MKSILFLLLLSNYILCLDLNLEESLNTTEDNINTLKKYLDNIEKEQIENLDNDELISALSQLSADTSPEAQKIKELLDEIGYEFENLNRKRGLNQAQNSIEIFKENYAQLKKNTEEIESNPTAKLENRVKELIYTLKDIKKPVLKNAALDITATGVGVWALKKYLLKNITREFDPSWITSAANIALVATMIYVISLVWIKIKEMFFDNTKEQFNQAKSEFNNANEELKLAQNRLVLLEKNNIELKKKIELALYLIGEQILPIVTAWDLEHPKRSFHIKNESSTKPDSQLSSLLTKTESQLRRQLTRLRSTENNQASSSSSQLTNFNSL
jgi:hypothetical protein